MYHSEIKYPFMNCGYQNVSVGAIMLYRRLAIDICLNS